MSAPGRKRPPKVVRPKKSALIWWVGTKFSDVLPLHRLGTKADKTVGATVTLPWKDKVTGKFTKAQAKIMAIDDEKKVHNMIVNSKGELQDLSEKIFHDSVIQQKKTLAENGKMVLSIAKSNKRRTDEKIKNDSGIFNKAMRDGFRGKRGKNIGNSTVTSGTYTQIESEKEVLHEQSYAPGPTIDPVHSDPNSREIRSWRDSNDVNESKGQSFHAESLDDFTAFQAWRRMNAFHNHETQKARGQGPSPIPQTPTYGPTHRKMGTTLQTNRIQGSPTSAHIPQFMDQRNTSGSSSQPQYWNRYPTENGPGCPSIHSSPSGLIHEQGDGNRSSEKTLEESLSSSSEVTHVPRSHNSDAYPESLIFRERESDNDGDPESDNDFDDSVKEMETEASVSDPWTEENMNIVGRALAGIFPVKITKQLVWMQGAVYAAMKFACEEDCKNDPASSESFEMPQSFLESGQNRVEIFPGAKFYLSSLSMAVIDRKVADADNKDKWKILIRQTLIHVYGKKLGLFSAKGAKVNSRPSINRQLFRGLVARAQTVSDEPIDEETLTKYINKMAFNKRRTSKVVINSENSESRKRAVANKGKLRKDVGSSSANNNLENHPPAQQLASVAQAIYQSPSNDINGNLGNLHSTPRLQDVHLSPLMHSNRSNNDPPPPSPGNLNAESGYHPSFSTFHHVGLDSHYGVEFAHAMEYSGRTTPFSGSSGRTYTQLH